MSNPETQAEKLARLRREQIERLKAWRARWLANRQAKRDAEAAAEAERLKAEEAARLALMGPPARVWRIGRIIMWEPPVNAHRLAPECYRIHGGGSVLHGDWTGDPNAREAQLLGDGAACVEAMYRDTGLKHCFISEPLGAPEGETGRDSMIVNHARFQASATERGKAHVKRWRRVLAAYGVVAHKVGHAGRPPVGPLDPPMSAAAAEAYAASDPDWAEVARTLRRLEGEGRGDAGRMGRIVEAAETFDGRRTRDGRPWVRPLRKHAEMPDITRTERDDAARIAGA